MPLGILKKAIESPSKIPSHLARQYTDLRRRRSTHPAIIQMVAGITDTERHDVINYYDELSDNKYFLKDVVGRGNFIGKYGIPEHALSAYLITRIIKPQVVVETGVHTGVSSAFFLRALADNGRGKLYSIDLPGTENDPIVDESSPYEEVRYTLPDKSKVGVKIPDRLRSEWELYLGRSDEHLPSLLDDLGSVDVFMHDSDHSYKNMMFEFETVLPYLSQNGVIISDDVDWNSSLDDFASKNNLQKKSLENYIDDEWKRETSIVGIMTKY